MEETQPGDEPPSHADLLKRLNRLVHDGGVLLAVDRKKLSHIDFPLGVEADGNRWAYPLVAISAALWWQFGTNVGIAAFVASFVVYQTAGRAYVAWRLKQRILTTGLAELDTWRKLWKFGGVILTVPGTGARAQGPDGSWIDLVRQIERA